MINGGEKELQEQTKETSAKKNASHSRLMMIVVMSLIFVGSLVIALYIMFNSHDDLLEIVMFCFFGVALISLTIDLVLIVKQVTVKAKPNKHEVTTERNSNMRICNNCGQAVAEQAKFCTGCGSPVIDVSSKKFCQNCGSEMAMNAAFCSSCGSPSNVYPNNPNQQNGYYPQNPQHTCYSDADRSRMLNTLSERVNINGIIWIVIGILQIAGGVFWDWFLLIVGVLNILYAVHDIQYSKTLLNNPRGVVAKFQPIGGAIVVLIYNLVIGGVIGVVGSIYYFVAIRNFVMENKTFFASLDQ